MVPTYSVCSLLTIILPTTPVAEATHTPDINNVRALHTYQTASQNASDDNGHFCYAESHSSTLYAPQSLTLTRELYST